MKRAIGLSAACLAVGVILSGCRGIVSILKPPDPTTNKIQANSRPRVYLVMFENQEFEKIIGNPNAPYINALAKQYGIATNLYANTHPSIGDYFMLTTGNVVTNDLYYSTLYDGDNLARMLGQQGVTWKAYLESLPSVGYEKDRAYPYVKSHNPFAYFSDIHYIEEQKDNMVPLDQLSQDISAGTVPSFVYIVPNQVNNMHDCPPGMATCTNNDKELHGDQWLQQTIAPILSQPSFQKDGLMIIAWDESWDNDSRNGGGHIPVILVGPNVKHGYQGNTYMQLESVLRLMCETLQVPNTLGAAVNAPPMSDFLINPSTSGPVQTGP
jgi:phosphatidylinositol-3-phosphatase